MTEETSAEPRVIGSLAFRGDTITVVRTEFTNGRLALLLDRNGASYSRLAVNMPKAELSAGEFFARTYAENEELRGPLLETGLFVDTGARLKTGFVELEVWRMVATQTATA